MNCIAIVVFLRSSLVTVVGQFSMEKVRKDNFYCKPQSGWLAHSSESAVADIYIFTAITLCLHKTRDKKEEWPNLQ